MTTITPAAARKEITRRASNKTGAYKAPAANAVAKAASRMGGAELRTLAGTTPSTSTVKTTQAEQVTLTDGRIAVIVAQAPATAKPAKAAKVARKTGVGSRGGDPIKALRAAVATSLVPNKSADFGGWMDAYKATRGMTEAELNDSLAAFASV